MRNVRGSLRTVGGICIVLVAGACHSGGSGIENRDGLPNAGGPSRPGNTGSDPVRPTREAIHVVLPEGETATATLHLAADIHAADVAFLMDTTGSMGDEANAVRNNFMGIADLLSGMVPDVAFGVAQYHDYAISPYGGSLDAPYQLAQPMTADRARVTAALEALSVSGGGDFPESQYEALFQLADGRGFDLNGDGAFQSQDVRPFVSSLADAFGGAVSGSHVADDGAFEIGGIGFRQGVFHVVVHVSDAHFRDPDSGWSLGNPGTSPSGKAAALAALENVGAHVIGVTSGPNPIAAMTEVAHATNAVADRDGDGESDDPLVYSVEADGVGLPQAVTDAIVHMLTTSEFAVALTAHDDAWGFVTPGLPIESVHPGEAVTFEVALTGTMPAAAEETRYEFSIELVSEDGTVLDVQPVVVVVPAAGT